VQQETLDFFSLGSPNSLDLNPVVYRIWGLMEEVVYIVQPPVRDISDLKQRHIDTWASKSRNIIEEAVGHWWRKQLYACLKAKGHHFKRLLN